MEHIVENCRFLQHQDLQQGIEFILKL